MAAITAALLTALNTGFRRDYQEGFDAMSPDVLWRDFAMEVPSTTASNTYGWLGQWPGFREWVGDRVVKDIKLSGYQIANNTYESTVGVKRDHIEDDNLGMYRPMMKTMGEEAAQHPDDLLFPMIEAGETTLCYDGQNFFDTDHPVAANHDGTGATTSASNLTAGAGTPWYLLDVRRSIRPFIVQMRRKPQFVTKFDARSSDHVFMSNEYLWGVDDRLNVGFGLWQLAHKSYADLTPDNLFAAMAAMEAVRGDGGKPLKIMPNVLVVPSSLRAKAMKALAERTDSGAAPHPHPHPRRGERRRARRDRARGRGRRARHRDRRDDRGRVMSGVFDSVNIGALPPPDVIETLDFEAILAELTADFAARWPEFDAWVESEPALKLLEVCAWRETIWRARTNDAARSVLLATATGADLEHLAALYRIGRAVVDPGDPDARPPVAPTFEGDASLRRRVQLALEAATAAGTEGRYVFYALGADGRVLDAAATSPAPGEVLISILSREPGGAPSADLLDAVRAVVDAPDVRQLCDQVTVAAATATPVALTATLTLAPGPGGETALAAARANAAALLSEPPRLGRGLARSRIFAALHVAGVEAVALAAPAADIAASPTEALVAGTISIGGAP